MNKDNRIKATLSKSHWEIVYSKLRGITKNSSDDDKKKAIQSHVISELAKIEIQCNNLPIPCVECKQQISIGLPISSIESLEYIAQKTGVNDPGLIVSKFIITPLLLKD